MEPTARPVERCYGMLVRMTCAVATDGGNESYDADRPLLGRAGDAYFRIRWLTFCFGRGFGYRRRTTRGLALVYLCTGLVFGCRRRRSFALAQHEIKKGNAAGHFAPRQKGSQSYFDDDVHEGSCTDVFMRFGVSWGDYDGSMCTCRCESISR